MSLAAVDKEVEKMPTIMFVDDEARVLKSMRAMFRRDYRVLLANSGEEALGLLAENAVDVVVSDQRMPHMTGVEVLSKIKQRSPDTVRILLTGYADLAAVEASLNEAEVYKYLMKPCPAEEVRGAVAQGLALRDGLAGAQVTKLPVKPARHTPASASVTPIRKAARPAFEASPSPTQAVQLLVLSRDKKLFEGVKEACQGHKVLQCESLDQAVQLVQKYPVGVLITDMGVDEKTVASLSEAVRLYTPDMVIILASERSDASVLIQLINTGQVFRFLLKPLQIGQCKIWLASALRRFVESGGEALAVFDSTVAKPSAWVRFKNWLLGV